MSYLRRFFRAVFPVPRRSAPAVWWLWPIGFVVAFAILCVVLDRASLLVFSRPAWLAGVLASVWVWWHHVAGAAGLPRLRGAVACGLRMLLIAAFAMVLAEPRSVLEQDILSVVYALDTSDSIGDEASDAALRFVLATASTKPPKDEAGLVVFGKRAAVETPPRPAFVVEALNTNPDRGATNIEQALALSAAMIPEDRQGRVVLLSDGVQTDGDLSRAVRDLQSRNITVDVAPIAYQYDREVWLERLDLPQFVKLGETYEAAVLVSSLQAGSGKLVLRENGRPIAEQQVDFAAGKNRFAFPLALRAAGYYEYSASIELPRGEDHLDRNNTVVNSLFLEGAGRLLLVVDEAADAREWRPLDQAIREADRFVEVKHPDAFPREPAALMPYDAVIFANVSHDQFDALQVTALRDAVYHLGVGFAMIGGPNSFGPGGYHRTPVEEILPVSMDASQKKSLPKGALAIILHTCEFAEGNTWGKRITKQALQLLNSKDEGGVLAYTEIGERWLFPLTEMSKRDELIPLINGAQIGDMPSFQNTMELGLQGLIASDASAKHMIIISDGDPQPPTPPTVQKFIDNKISVSMVAVFPHGGLEISKMQAVAELTGGRYYYVNDDPSRLPAIFIKEAKTLKRSMIQTRKFQPEVGFPSPILKGINTMPELQAYVLTTLKPRAQRVLHAPPSPEEPDDIDPVLAVWQHGLGKTAAFTSDLGPKWAAEWMSWEHYRAFVAQLLLEIARTRKETTLRVGAQLAGNEVVVTAEDFSQTGEFLEVTARVSGPGDRVETIPLKQVRPNRYQATMPLWGHGRYHIAAAAAGGGRKDQAFGGFIVPYSPEYLRFRANPIVLEDLAKQTGGQVLSADATSAEIYEREREPRRSSRPIFDWFLWVLAFVIPADVGLRRVQLDFSAIRLWLFPPKVRQASEATAALLQRKQQVSAELDQRKERPLAATAPLPTRSTSGTKPAAPTPQKTPPTAAATAEPAKDANAPTSTTERLLQLKKRREGQEG